THDLRELNVNDLGPVIARDVDLSWSAAAPCLLDHSVEYFRNARGITHFLLVANHVLEKGHLRYFLKAALPHSTISRLRRDKNHGRVVPVGGLYRRDKACHARPILCNSHRHFAGGACIAVVNQSGIGLVSTIPKADAGL